MLNAQPPTIAQVDVIATQPTAGDLAMTRRLSEASSAEAAASEPTAVYVVRIQLAEKPTVSGSGWALYIGDERVAKYWEYPEGIYFKVLDQSFLARHAGHALRFSANGKTFMDTGKHISSPPNTDGTGETESAARVAVPSLPTQAEVLGKKK